MNEVDANDGRTKSLRATTRKTKRSEVKSKKQWPLNVGYDERIVSVSSVVEIRSVTAGISKWASKDVVATMPCRNRTNWRKVPHPAERHPFAGAFVIYCHECSFHSIRLMHGPSSLLGRLSIEY